MSVQIFAKAAPHEPHEVPHEVHLTNLTGPILRIAREVVVVRWVG